MKRFIILLGLIIIISGCGRNRGKGSDITIAVEFTAHSACAHIAKHKGWYKEEGLNVISYESYVTGMALASALTRGDIDAAYICLVPAINARANAKVPIKVVAGIHKYGYGFVINPDKIKKASDLLKEDIHIGCTREGSPTDALYQQMIEKLDLNKEKLLKKTYRMNPPMQLFALKTGKIDAGFICEQYPSMAEESGFKIFLNAKDIWPEMQGSVLVVREELIGEYPEIVRKLVKVTKKATEFINRHPEEASGILRDELQVTGKKIFPVKAIDVVSKIQISDSSLLKSLTQKMVNTTDIDRDEIQKTIDACEELGYIKKRFEADDFIDLRFNRR